MKFFFSFSILVLCAIIVQSQTNPTVETNSTDIRFFAGFNVTKLTSDQNNTEIDSVDHTTSYSGRPGFELGLAATFGNRFYIQPGLKFSQISAEVINESNIDEKKFEDLTTVSILTVPLKVGFRLINQDTEDFLNIRVFAGLDGLFVLGVNHNEKSEKIDDLSKDDFQNIIFNGELGAGIDLWIFYLDLGFQIGLTPVFAQSEIDVKANTFYSNLGVRIKF